MGPVRPCLMGPHLPPLNAAQLETLLAALDPQLAGFGGGNSWVADARAYLHRLGDEADPTLVVWLEAWEQAEGNRQTLHLAATALLEQLNQVA